MALEKELKKAFEPFPDGFRDEFSRLYSDLWRAHGYSNNPMEEQIHTDWKLKKTAADVLKGCLKAVQHTELWAEETADLCDIIKKAAEETSIALPEGSLKAISSVYGRRANELLEDFYGSIKRLEASSFASGREIPKMKSDLETVAKYFGMRHYARADDKAESRIERARKTFYHRGFVVLSKDVDGTLRLLKNEKAAGKFKVYDQLGFVGISKKYLELAKRYAQESGDDASKLSGSKAQLEEIAEKLIGKLLDSVEETPDNQREWWVSDKAKYHGGIDRMASVLNAIGQFSPAYLTGKADSSLTSRISLLKERFISLCKENPEYVKQPAAGLLYTFKA